VSAFKDKKIIKYTARIALLFGVVICEKYFLGSYLIAILAILSFSIAVFINIKNLPSYLENHFRQTESLLSLYFTVKPDYPMPNTRGFAASPDLLKKISEAVLEKKPELVVEASSGVSTLLIAYCLKRQGHGKVICLEHDEKYASITRGLIKTHGLEDIAEVLHAPLVSFRINDSDWLWYDTYELESYIKNSQNQKIDLFIVDGPPKNVQEFARFPALPVLFERMSDDCVIILDDAKRNDEQQVVSMWKKMFEFTEMEFLDLEKGAIIIKGVAVCQDMNVQVRNA
jgi:predicted O-methyltransferase YrrM